MNRVAEALSFTGTVEKMLQDPDLRGELLALGVVLAYDTNWTRARERLGWSGMHLRAVLRSDIPRYEPAQPPDRRCLAPMIRREGPCGRPSSTFAWHVDPYTGYRTPEQLCRRHADLNDDQARREAYALWQQLGKPQPPANVGGVLARYVVCDWDRVYDWASPHRTVPGTTTVARPVLTLVHGGRAPGPG